MPFPLGGCFGYWGYDLKGFVEPRLTRRAVNDLELPDCHLGFYPSLVVFDHQLGKAWIVATGLDAEGNRSEARARAELKWWKHRLAQEDASDEAGGVKRRAGVSPAQARGATDTSPNGQAARQPYVTSSLTRAEFLSAVERAQRYIRAGDIYQVNLSQP